ncbi:hypothetical protein QZH41_008622 [Actinostola sp. cb2023]|nr:hypothetical protein QZH41_008622 [Actinostola sp. cb2023]
MEDVCFDVEKLEEMKRPQLQKLCKKFGIKANSKTNQLIRDLKDYAKAHSSEDNEKPKTPKSKTPESSVVRGLADSTCQEQVKDEVSDKNNEEQSYREEIMQQLERKVQETLKESKIPRLTGRNVTFTVGSTSPDTKSSSKKREHSAFKKMDSIDVYLEKKRKRTQSFYVNFKKAKNAAHTARNIIADMKASHNTPARESPSKKKQSARSKKTEDLHVPTSFSFGQLKSPKLVKPVFVFGKEKQKTPAASRKSLCSVNKAKENETPYESRKSIVSTPFGLNATMDTTVNVPAKKKFDLQASLSKPLAYKPHRGKIEKFPYVNKVSKIPAKVIKKPLTDHKVDVKNVKITLRYLRLIFSVLAECIYSNFKKC